MSPLVEAQTRVRSASWSEMSSRRALLIFALCLVVGLGAVAWRSSARVGTARAIARVEARARGASLELQLSQVSSAAEVLAALAKQGRGGLTNFQRVATELLAAHPALASLEIQPGGVVSDIVPRAGHERAVGFNVLKDSGQRVGANEAIARRALTVAGPVKLDHGEQGIVARVPIFQRASDGRDSFWGFVAVSMRLPEALSRAQVDELVPQGYDFALFVPPTGQLRAVPIASHGLSHLQDTVQQPVHAQNLEFRLALQPRGGWFDKTTVVLESLTALLVSALVWLLVNLRESRRALETELTEATQRLVRETADRSQAQADCNSAKERMASAQAELKEAQNALQEAESKAAQSQARLDASNRARDEITRVHQGELKEAHAALQTARETIVQQQTRLDSAVRSEKDTESAAQKQFQQNQAAIAELQVQLEAARHLAQVTAEKNAAKVAQLEQSNRALKARLHVAEKAEARVIDLNEHLQKAQEKLRCQQEASIINTGVASRESPDVVPSETVAEGSQPKVSAELSGKENPTPALTVGEDVAGKVKEDRPGLTSSELNTPGSTEPSASESASVQLRTDANSAPPHGAVEMFVDDASSLAPSVTHKTVKAARRQKARPDNQLRLFGNQVSPVPTTDQQAAVEAEARIPEVTEPEIPGIKAAVPFGTPVSDPPKTPSGQAASQELLEESSKRSVPKPQPTAKFETVKAEAQSASGTTPRVPSRRLSAAPPVDPGELRKAANQILPLLAERDPGAKDCLRDNRKTFRPAFTPEAFVEFEQLVKNGDFEAALEQLKKAARKHGLSL